MRIKVFVERAKEDFSKNGIKSFEDIYNPLVCILKAVGGVTLFLIVTLLGFCGLLVLYSLMEKIVIGIFGISHTSEWITFISAVLSFIVIIFIIGTICGFLDYYKRIIKEL